MHFDPVDQVGAAPWTSTSVRTTSNDDYVTKLIPLIPLADTISTTGSIDSSITDWAQPESVESCDSLDWGQFLVRNKDDLPREPTAKRERYESKEYLILTGEKHNTVRQINRTTTIPSPCVVQNVLPSNATAHDRTAVTQACGQDSVTQNVASTHASAPDRTEEIITSLKSYMNQQFSTLQHENRKEFDALLQVLKNESRQRVEMEQRLQHQLLVQEEAFVALERRLVRLEAKLDCVQSPTKPIWPSKQANQQQVLGELLPLDNPDSPKPCKLEYENKSVDTKSNCSPGQAKRMEVTGNDANSIVRTETSTCLHRHDVDLLPHETLDSTYSSDLELNHHRLGIRHQIPVTESKMELILLNPPRPVANLSTSVLLTEESNVDVGSHDGTLETTATTVSSEMNSLERKLIDNDDGNHRHVQRKTNSTDRLRDVSQRPQSRHVTVLGENCLIPNAPYNDQLRDRYNALTALSRTLEMEKPSHAEDTTSTGTVARQPPNQIADKNDCIFDMCSGESSTLLVQKPMTTPHVEEQGDIISPDAFCGDFPADEGHERQVVYRPTVIPQLDISQVYYRHSGGEDSFRQIHHDTNMTATPVISNVFFPARKSPNSLRGGSPIKISEFSPRFNNSRDTS